MRRRAPARASFGAIARSTGQNPKPARSIAARALNCPHSSSSTSFDAIRSRREREIDETDTFRVVERAPWLDSRVARDMNADEMIADGDANGVDVRALDEAMAMDDDHASARKSASSAPANANPPLPPNARPRHEGRGGANGHGGERRRGGGERGGGRGGGRFQQRERAPTRPGWFATGEVDEHSGRPAHSGQCEGCRVSTVVNFRPVVGGNPPLCGVCLDSLKAATAGGSVDGDNASGGPNRGRRGGRNGAMMMMGMPHQGGFQGGARFSPYASGGQMVMIDPRMMAAYGGGRGGGMMAAYGAAGAGGGGGRGKNRTWMREGGDAGAGVGGQEDVDTSGIPCIFFQRGACRAGDSCKYSHSGEGSGAAPAEMNVEM